MQQPYIPKKGDFFICTSDSFENAKIHHAYENEKENGELYAYFYAPGTKETAPEYIHKRLLDFPGPYFPVMLWRPEKIVGLETEFNLYRRIGRKIEDYLLTQEGYAAKIEELIRHLTKDDGEKRKEAETIIKVLTSELIGYRYKKLKTGEYIEFSDLKTGAEKGKIYYGSIADEISIKSERISLLVSHGQTVGNYRELILRQLLRKYIPSKFNVATGFIEGLKRQVDILVYDAQNHVPTFIEGDLVVIRPEAVRAIIEVKTDLTTDKLQESLQFFYDLTRPGIYKPDIPIFKGIYAFDSPYREDSSMAGAIFDFYNKPFFHPELHLDMTNDIMYLQHEITCISVLKKHCLFSQYNFANDDETGNIVPWLYSISDQRQLDVQSAMFIAILFDYLDVDYNGKLSATSGFSRIYQSKTVSMKRERKLTPDDWIPRTASQGEHDFQQPSIRARLEKIGKWFTGELSTSEFIK